MADLSKVLGGPWAPPPEKLVENDVNWIVEREQEEDSQAPQTNHQNHGDGSFLALQHGHGEVEEEGQSDDHNTELGG